MNALDFIKDKIGDFVPEIAVILGSGLSHFTDGLEGVEIPYSEIEGFVPASVQGHKGSLFFYENNGRKILVMQGRFHFYEGHSIQTITYPIKIFKKLGVKTLILTNAAGALDKSFAPGDLLLIKDHINFMGDNPLIGKNDDSMGVRFPDMSEVYDKNLRDKVLSIAQKNNIGIKEGVYLATTGPSYETPSEVKMLKLWGADVVGMSTVPEAIVANWCGIKVIGISLVSNYASGVGSQKLSHQEVIEAGNLASSKIKTLLNAILNEI